MKNKRITRPIHVRQILSEQINQLRKDEATDVDIDKARAIGYLSNVVLTAIKDGELEQRIKDIEQQLKDQKEGVNNG